jgi:hypothetical protein
LQDSTYPMAPPPPPPPSNPYAAPIAPYAAGPSGSLAEAERIRHELIKHEVGVQTIGNLYLLGAIVGVIALVGLALVTVFGMTSGSAEGERLEPIPMLVMLVIGGLATWLYFWIGVGLRRLDRKVRTVAIVLAAIGLLGFPLGTLINGYFLYLLASEKGGRVLSPEYQAVVAATPHIKYKSPWLIGCLILFVVLGAITAIAIYTSA